MGKKEVHKRFDKIMEKYRRYKANYFDKDRDIFLKRVENSLEKMNIQDREILKKTFFKEDYVFWWVDIYPRSTFYRKRYVSMKNFVGGFINE